MTLSGKTPCLVENAALVFMMRQNTSIATFFNEWRADRQRAITHVGNEIMMGNIQ